MPFPQLSIGENFQVNFLSNFKTKKNIKSENFIGKWTNKRGYKKHKSFDA